MNLSPSFILGLIVLVLADHWLAPLPGQAYPARYFWFAVALSIPVLVAAWTGTRLKKLARLGEPPGAALRTLCRLGVLSVPAGMFVMVDRGGLVAFAEQAGGDSHLAQFAILLTALLALETGRRTIDRRTIRALDAARVTVPAGLATGWSRMTVFVALPILLFAATLDVVESDRTMAVFLHGTSVGTTVGLLVTVAALSAALPILFRFVLPTRRTLPWQVADDVRSAAARLGFPLGQILALDTRHRMVNAALVGPLRWPRYLILTDGILSCLDGYALQGVVAHEVGHARAGHPALLLVVFGAVPILLLQPVVTIDPEAWPPEMLVGAGAALALMAFFSLRWLMHRFEYEADQLSAAALGGAMPCIHALRRVGDLFPGHRTRTSFRHPSEDQRVRSLLAWEADPAYRVAFARRGRAVRACVAGIALVAAGLSGWAHLRAWPLDAVVMRFYTGDFAGAEAGLAALEPIPAGVDGAAAKSLSEEVRVATELMGPGGDWQRIAPELADRAWRSGVAIAASQGAAAARPWFALATLGPDDDAVRESAWLWSEASAAGDEPRVARVAAHLRELPGVPEPLRAAARVGRGD